VHANPNELCALHFVLYVPLLFHVGRGQDLVFYVRGWRFYEGHIDALSLCHFELHSCEGAPVACIGSNCKLIVP
jgi:hypothetical protein